MCGIAGGLNLNDNQISDIKKNLYHRGPDEQHHISYNNVSLVHTRLSVQDINGGHQPFHYNNYIIIYNGEIYNHLEIRSKYLGEFNFKTYSDTETLLYLYIKFKEKMFDKIDGMFALSIYNKDDNTLFLARDRSGKKPLYIYKKNKKFLFASELNVIKSIIPNLDINESQIYSYLRTGFFYDKNTAYSDIDVLEAGSYIRIDFNTMAITKAKYFNILGFYNTPTSDSFEDSLLTLEKLLHRSIKDRLLSSDLEVGAFLSGGIDSSLVVAIASEYKKKIKTFTVKFDGAYDESHLARLTAQKYNTDHHELHISMDLKNDIEKILYNYGQPFMDSSAIPSFYVSQEAKKHVSVVLNGDGADELFGGYRRYVPAANGMLKVANKISFLLSILPNSHNKKSYYNYFYRLLSMSKKTGLDFYLSSTTDIFEDVYSFNKKELFWDMEKDISNIQNSKLSRLSQMLLLDFNTLLFSDLLVKMDIATMSHSLEGRSPFLSKYMLEFAPTLKDSYKIKGKNTKYILRELSKKYLPSILIHQPKRGFEVPLVSWVEKDLKDNVFTSLKSNSYSSSFIKQSFINNLLENKVNVSKEKRAKMLWNMYCLEIWKKNQ